MRFLPLGNAHLLKPGRVHVWYASIDRTRAEIGEFERALSPEEAERARRFRFLKNTA